MKLTCCGKRCQEAPNELYEPIRKKPAGGNRRPKIVTNQHSRQAEEDDIRRSDGMATATERECEDANKVAEKTDEQKKAEQRQSMQDHRAKILQQLRTFDAYDGFEMTNCAFVKSNVEICYILKDACRSIDKEMLKESLTSHLGIHAGDLRLMELRSRPVYKKTSIQPGDPVCLIGPPQSQSSIGAFVTVSGKGIHAIMCGHDKIRGDRLRNMNGNEFGTVEVVSLTPLPNILFNEDAGFRDIALASLNNHIPFNSTVTTGDGTVLRLEADPEEAYDGMPVRLFINGDRKGTIRSASYFAMDTRLNITHRFLSVQNSEGQAVHVEGESGILIAAEPAGIPAIASCSVPAVGILDFLEEKEYVEDDGIREEVISLAAPLEPGFDALRRDPYCNGEVKFW